jgi:large subunit ribosomal protein L24
MAAKIKKGDRVVVLAGKDKGRQGNVTRVFPTENRVLVEGVNVVQRHTRASQTNPQGRHRQQGSADPRVQRGLRRPQVR